MKHLYSLSLLLLALLLPVTAHAHDFMVDGIYYKINGNEATVTYKGSSYNSRAYSGSVTIPATVTYGGTTYSVTSIGDNAFYNCSDLTSVTIPNSVTSIGDYAFWYCSGLTNVTIPNSVTTIGAHAFSGCSGLTSIDIPNSVTIIGNQAFYRTAWYNNKSDGLIYAGLVAYKYKGTMPSGTSIIIRDGTRSITDMAFSYCSGLTSIEIPNSVTSIGESAFEYCSGLSSVIIPNSVKTIGIDAFSNCSSLTSINIPISVTSFGYGAFSGCCSLTSIVVASGNPNYDSRNNCNAIIETATNTLITGCMNTAIPNSVTTIGVAAFGGCSGLTSIDIPNSVTAIGEYAFYGCSGLTSIDIPYSVTSIGGSAFGGCSGLTSVIIPNSVTTISIYAFEYCSGLTSITIPSSVKYMGMYAFNGCTALTTLNYNAIDCTNFEAPFYGLGITTINIGDRVQTIPAFFASHFPLEIIIIPNSVTTIGESAFGGCTGLTSVTIPSSVTAIGSCAFEGCSSVTNVTIPNSVTSIGNWAFSGCTGLTEIYSLALTPATVSSSTFSGCYSATLYVPYNALDNYNAAEYWKEFTNIESNTFEVDSKCYRVMDESSLSVIANNDEESLYTGDVVIPDSVAYEGMTFAVTGIESNAFDGCFELTSLVIPNSVETIGEQAFQGCTGLTSVTIGSGVTDIGAKAFNYCNALETVKCLGTVPPVMTSADCFTNTAYNRATLLVPRQQIEAYQAADYWYKFAHIDGWGSAGRGDIDGDGVVSIRDVTTLIDAILNGNNEGVYFESADVNINGRLDIGDVTTIVDMLLNDIE